MIRLKLWLGAALGVALALLAAWGAGLRQARQAALTRALRGKVKAHETRERIEDAIEADVDLASRARRAGVLRPGSE